MPMNKTAELHADEGQWIVETDDTVYLFETKDDAEAYARIHGLELVYPAT